MNIHDVETPLNATERFLHAIVVRQNILIEQMSSFLDAYAKVNKLHTESNKVTVDVKEVEPQVVAEVKQEIKVEAKIEEGKIIPNRKPRTKK